MTTTLALLIGLVLQSPDKLSLKIEAQPSDNQVRVGRKVIMRLKVSVPEGKKLTSTHWMTFPAEIAGFDQWENGMVADFATPAFGVYVFIAGVATDGEMAMDYHVIQVGENGAAESTPPPVPRIVPKPTQPPPEPHDPAAATKQDGMVPVPPKPRKVNLAAKIRDCTREQFMRGKSTRTEARQIATIFVQTANEIDTGGLSGDDFINRVRRLCAAALPGSMWGYWFDALNEMFSSSDKALTISQKSTSLRNIAEILLEESKQ